MFDITPLLPGFQHTERDVRLGTEIARVVSPDARRVILYLTNSADKPLSLWFGAAIREDRDPHFVVPAGTTRRFTWSEDGPMSTYGWCGAYDQQGGSVVVIEILWLPDQIGA